MTTPNQALQATAVKRLGWHVGCQRPAVPEFHRSAELTAAYVCLPWVYTSLLRLLGEKPDDAASELLGLSNTTDFNDGADRMKKIQALLRLPRIAA